MKKFNMKPFQIGNKEDRQAVAELASSPIQDSFMSFEEICAKLNGANLAKVKQHIGNKELALQLMQAQNKLQLQAIQQKN